ncbi:MAG: response regulator containing CheY-like receiver domain and AraC-type DNA-binding domain, partial [Firmicutes bacterium]|nr:response regulator containing CheY-like receiver domain and AraC-type DNA-binding domain [Bacillota bacterium]
NEYKIPELYAARKKLTKLFYYNVGIYSKAFHEEEAEQSLNDEVQILDLEKLVEHVANKDKNRILNYLKQVFDELSAYKKLNLHSLYLMKQEIMQVVYADLMNQGIQATKLFYDEFSIKLADRATNSTVDMIRWVNYLLEKTFEYEDEVAKAATIIEKINKYIHEHYAEEIGRNEISAEFYLTPEYLAKLYKKKTGVNLKDYINEYRIEKAKELLRAGEKNISMVAESVGFDNFTYFSTLFKKMTGVSPKDYKRN